MSTEHIIQSVIELVAIGLLLYGMAHEQQLIKFEQNVKRIIVGNYKHWKRNRRK